jgi:hypothetical protein
MTGRRISRALFDGIDAYRALGNAVVSNFKFASLPDIVQGWNSGVIAVIVHLLTFGWQSWPMVEQLPARAKSIRHWAP